MFGSDNISEAPYLYLDFLVFFLVSKRAGNYLCRSDRREQRMVLDLQSDTVCF